MNNGNKLEKLQCTFPKLTEANQHYVLGLTEGLKRAQGSKVGERTKEVKAGWGNKQMRIVEKE